MTMLGDNSAFFSGLKAFQSAQTIAGVWDVGKEVMVLREMGVPRVTPSQSGQGDLLINPNNRGLVRTTSAGGGHQLPRSASSPVDGVRQARIT